MTTNIEIKNHFNSNWRQNKMTFEDFMILFGCFCYVICCWSYANQFFSEVIIWVRLKVYGFESRLNNTRWKLCLSPDCLYPILVQAALVICGLFICNFMYMRLKNGVFSGTYPLIYGNPRSFYMWIHYIRAIFGVPISRI